MRKSVSLLLTVALGMTAAGCGKKDTPADNGKVSITVGCEPAKSQPILRKEWLEDVAAFERLHPNITIVSKDAFPCADPKTFNAKLAGGKMENVFYGYFTDIRNVIASGEAADISQYVNTSTVKQLNDLQPSVEGVFKDAGGKIYGLPRQNYTMGLLYNRMLFKQAGLDPDNPPKTWDEVRAAAKKIAGLGNGMVGYADYSAANTGGWHFTTEIYSRGGDVVTPDGKKAAFNSPQGQAVLQGLQQMRWTDNSMGSRQLLQLSDVQGMMAAGKLGMFLAAPDNVTTLVDNFKGDYKVYGLAAMPEGQGTLIGGDGFMFNVKDTPAQIKAGVQWLEYYALTPGQGQLNYARSAADHLAVGIPQPELFTGQTGAADAAARAKSATVPAGYYKPYEETTPQLKGKLEPPQAQQIYAVLDGAMSAVLTERNADIGKLLADAESKVNAILSRSS